MSTNEVAKYQAAKEDEGFVARMHDLECKGRMMECSASMIYEKRMEMRQEHQDQGQNLQGLLSSTEGRLNEMEICPLVLLRSCTMMAEKRRQPIRDGSSFEC